jgi:ferredoxin, 2Fe-2S
MAKITYIENNGEKHVINVESGKTVMRGAVENSVRGIIGDCGGACSCATCHVYVDPAWVEKVGKSGETEAMLLEEVCDPQANSRLSCQITVTDDMDGLIVRLPVKQV